MGVFLLVACSEPSTTTEPAPVEAIENLPLLTLSELLSAVDVKNGLAVAAESADVNALEYWQVALLEAAEQVNLAENELALISGKQGLVFLEFQGMKTNYQREFEHAFFNFGDVDSVYQRYPAFETLHQRSKELVNKRDELVNSITQHLIEQGQGEEALANARAQWQTSMRVNEILF